MHALEKLFEFPYIENYLELSLVEWELAELTPSAQIAFLGGGPYPLTAISLALIAQATSAGKVPELRALLNQSDSTVRRSGLHTLLLDCHNHEINFSAQVVERNPEALELSIKVISALGLDRSIKVLAMDAADYRVPNGCRALFLASMVREKLRVLRSIFSAPPTHSLTVLLRSVQSGTLRELLYEPVSAEVRTEELLAIGLTPAKEFTPQHGSRLINSVEVYKFEPGFR